MGQCSTLPTNRRSAAARRERATLRPKDEDPATLHHTDRAPYKTVQGKEADMLHVQTASGTHHPVAPQARNPEHYINEESVPMEEDSPRDGIPQPPKVATRTRCYKLNLDSDMDPHPNTWLGPFDDTAPPLTYTTSEDSCLNVDPTQIAIQTAKIFRGITVAKDGTILSQNARATRSNRGKKDKNKRGEKSRQAAKIQKAKDLVEESILTGKAPASEEPANMLSLVIMGEYDDMKHLVRDGSKKLRDASELPDGTLFSVNKTREGAPMPLQSMSLSSPRKRMSPGHFGGKQPGSHMNMAGLPQSTPPKLRSHPRDRQGNRRQQIDDRSAKQDVGAHAEEKHQQGNGRGEDGDWSNALGLSGGFRSIWTCGGTVETSGTVSPTQVVNQRGDGKANAVDMVTTPFRPVFDGRDSGYAQAREPGATPRA